MAWHAGRGLDPTRESGVARVDWRSTPVEPGVARTGCEQKIAMNEDDDDDNNDDDDDDGRVSILFTNAEAKPVLLLALITLASPLFEHKHVMIVSIAILVIFIKI